MDVAVLDLLSKNPADIEKNNAGDITVILSQCQAPLIF
jgi:hypothetical protein